MKRPLISVVIPVFERPDELKRALVSALAELNPGDELIVVDDGSKPPIVPKGPIWDDPRLRLIRSDENKGAASARNWGIANAQHKILAFLDSDDVWLPGKLDAQLRLFTKQTDLVAVVCGWADIKNGLLIQTRIPFESNQRQDFFSGCWFAPGSTLIISKDAFDICGPFREDLLRLEDFEWFIRFATLGGRLVVAPIVGVKISKDNNARLGLVEISANLIFRLHRKNSDISRFEWSGMSAYLWLTQASAAYGCKNWPKFAIYMFRSLISMPRFTLHSKKWWILG